MVGVHPVLHPAPSGVARGHAIAAIIEDATGEECL